MKPICRAIVPEEARVLAQRHLAAEGGVSDYHDRVALIDAFALVVESGKSLSALTLSQWHLDGETIYEIYRILEDGLQWEKYTNRKHETNKADIHLRLLQ